MSKIRGIRFAGLASSRPLVLPFLALSAAAVGAAASAQTVFTPGNLVVSRSNYSGTPSTVTVGQTLPPGCVPNTANKVTCGSAIADGTFPAVFNNVITADPAFGITAPLYLDQLAPNGNLISTLPIPNNTLASGDGLVTSFSSKSEGGLHLSLDGQYLTFMDYVASVNTIDVSNSSTPGAPDPTDPVPVSSSFYRAAATVNAKGQFSFTETNAYSGNNGREAILVNTNGNNFFYTTGNAGDGGTPEPQNVVLGAGLQLIPKASTSEAAQSSAGVGLPMPVGSFNVSQLPGVPANTDKVGKDDNFRGLTVYNNVVYVTKGSGGNGVNTVYFVDTTGTACPNGTGLPAPNATLPTTNLAPTYNATTGLQNNMCILAGFSTVVNKFGSPTSYPFDLFFASPTVLYVADEGAGVNTYSPGTGPNGTYTAAASSTGGVQKWIFNSGSQTWQLAYTLRTGLNLGVPYTVAGLSGNNSATGLPYSPATAGLRHMVGSLQGNRIQGQSVVLWAISSTVSGNGDQGADPNKLYVITDRLNNTSPSVAAQESFTDLYDASYAQVLRGVSFTPGTTTTTSY